MYQDGYRGVTNVNGRNAVSTATAIIVVVAILYLTGIGFAFKGSVHF